MFHLWKVVNHVRLFVMADLFRFAGTQLSVETYFQYGGYYVLGPYPVFLNILRNCRHDKLMAIHIYHPAVITELSSGVF